MNIDKDNHMIKSRKPTAYRALALLGMALLLGACSHSGNLAAGKRYQADGKYQAAYIEAKKVLQQDQDNAQAWLLLGEASLQLGDANDAVADLENARKHGVPEAQWAVPLGQALLVNGKRDELLKTVSAKPAFDPALQARIEVLRGNAYLGLKKSDEAKTAFESALKLQPDDARALAGMARLAQRAGDTDAAQTYLKQALAKAPQNPQAWMAKGDLAFAAEDFTGAAAAYTKVLGFEHADWLPQERFVTRARLAEAQTRLGQLQQAQTNIAQLQKLSPEQPYPHYLQAVVSYKQGKLDDAVTQLQQVLKASPDNSAAQLLMGEVNYAQGNYSQAQMYLSNVLGEDATNVRAHRLLALTYFREGRASDAFDTLKSTLPGDPDDASLRALLQKAVAEGAATPKASRTMAPHAASPSAPQNAAATPADHGPFADARQALARGDDARAIQLLQAKPATAANDAMRTQLLAAAYMRDNHPKEALKVAADYAGKHPQDGNALVLYGTVLMAAGQRDNARDQYAKAHKLDPKNKAALMDLAGLDAIEGHPDDAARGYESVLQLDPHDSDALIALGQLAVRKGDTTEAIKRFRQAIAAAPKESKAYVALVMLYSHAGQFDEAAAVAKQLADAHPGNPATLSAYGVAQLNAGHTQAALAPLEQAVQLAPNEPMYRTNLARAQALNHNIKDAKANLEKVLEADPAQVQAATLLAYMKLHDHDLDGALALAHKLQQQPSARAAGYMLEGDLQASAKAYAKAADAYHEGMQANYNRALVIKYFLALERSGAKAPATVLETWLAKHPDDDTARLLLARHAMEHTHYKAAAAQYEKVLQKHPSSVGALNNLAWIYTEQHNPKALALAARAYKLAPTSTGVQDTYGWALIAADRPKDALPILAKAAKANSATAAIRYHLAVAQARSGDTAAARATLEDLRKSGGTFPDQRAADKLYDTLAKTRTQGANQ